MLNAAADRLLARVGHWTQARWAKPASSNASPNGAVSRADLVFGLVSTLADLCADAEGRPRLPVPRLENELALVDQVRVMVLDLLLAPAPDPVLHEATTHLNTTTNAL